MFQFQKSIFKTFNGKICLLCKRCETSFGKIAFINLLSNLFTFVFFQLYSHLRCLNKVKKISTFKTHCLIFKFSFVYNTYLLFFNYWVFIIFHNVFFFFGSNAEKQCSSWFIILKWTQKTIVHFFSETMFSWQLTRYVINFRSRMKLVTFPGSCWLHRLVYIYTVSQTIIATNRNIKWIWK